MLKITTVHKYSKFVLINSFSYGERPNYFWRVMHLLYSSLKPFSTNPYPLYTLRSFHNPLSYLEAEKCLNFGFYWKYLYKIPSPRFQDSVRLTWLIINHMIYSLAIGGAFSTCTLSLCELQVTILSIKLNTTCIFQNISLQSTPLRNCRSSHTS